MAWCTARVAEGSQPQNENVEKKEDEGEKHEGDDPMAFQTMRNKKLALIEGIKRFNFKPKKVFKQRLFLGNPVSS